MTQDITLFPVYGGNESNKFIQSATNTNSEHCLSQLGWNDKL